MLAMNMKMSLRPSAASRTKISPNATSSLRISSLFGSKLQQAGSMRMRAARNLAGRVQASFFGVGAPEAVVVGVVALIVFGPKGLADAVKSIGQTLRSFQPTIREVAQISTELKSTLEQEIGLDEIKKEIRGVNSTTTTTAEPPRAFSETVAAVQEPNLEDMRRKSAEMAWGAGAGAAASTSSQDGNTNGNGATSPQPASPAAAVTSQPTTAPTAAASLAPAKDLSQMSVEELEAELARRKSLKN